MGRSQPQYRIVANRRCKTHKPGTQITYTGPRGEVSPGWTVLYRCNGWLMDGGAGLV